MGAGWADVGINDLLFTALLVLASCILLGLLRPRWPWRWVIVVGACIPLTELAAYKILTVKPTRAQIYGSFLRILPGHCWGLRRFCRAQCGGESAAGKVTARVVGPWGGRGLGPNTKHLRPTPEDKPSSFRLPS